ncbi:FKBP-type peptidyl-prolyl cis-trans isomerase, partial [Francisella tularensis]|uniref:FKBP-type peptidyl-prolyl cis-trans isomerase n=1 Tax=Francisella tularensis TaxID=263 RepID=UPI0023AC2DE6|nr:peptidylprolyl isomerase [Francisella tularensis subsp. holarctica]
LICTSFDYSDSETFPLRNLIDCWKDAIPQIPNGSTIILYCSPDKEYGTRAPAVIGHNHAISFEITLKDFK